MAGTTILIRDGFHISNISRLMDKVTCDTDVVSLSFTMWLMTFHAVWNVSMFVMVTEYTVKFAMGAGVIFNFTNLIAMAGITCCYIVFTKNDMKWLVRILMTAQAVGYFIMGLAFMAHGTFWNKFFFWGAGGMTTHMAVKAAYFGQVLCTSSHVVMCNLCMTFYTIAVFQFWIRCPDVAR